MPRATAWIPKMAFVVLKYYHPEAEVKEIAGRHWGDIGTQRKISATKKSIRHFQIIERKLLERGSTYIPLYGVRENYRIRESIRSALRSLSKAVVK